MLRLLTVLATLGLVLGTAAGPSAQDQIDPAQLQTAETQMGQQFYQQIQQKGEILQGSPYEAVLAPVAAQIKRVADSQYYHPFTFILVHEDQPNAFAVPGGNVYVTDSLMKMVENREELAGVLCHETSHDIHHDVVNNMIKDQRAQRNAGLIAGLASVLTGGHMDGLIGVAANIDVGLTVTRYSRTVETAADIKGADTCAQAGSNPWGMVWLFKRFEKASSGGQLSMLSDHPTDDQRIRALQAHFAQSPSLFRKFSSNMTVATALPKPRDV
jgi:predicted Zn-dependent protease